eukprot:7259233-Pyramimonas_sp.AAC.2
MSQPDHTLSWKHDVVASQCRRPPQLLIVVLAPRPPAFRGRVFFFYHVGGRSKGEQQQHERSDHDPRLTRLRLLFAGADQVCDGERSAATEGDGAD